MRLLLGLIAIGLLLAVCGWITVSWNGDRASVNVETEKIEADSQHIVEEGRDLIEGVSKTDDPAVPQEETPAEAQEPVLEPNPSDSERRQ